jgi:hypothetical protein
MKRWRNTQRKRNLRWAQQLNHQLLLPVGQRDKALVRRLMKRLEMA